MTKRRLHNREAVVRLNETIYRGSVARALINHSPSRIQAIKLIIEVDSVGTVDKDGNVLAVNNDGYEWETFATAHDPWIDMDDNI